MSAPGPTTASPSRAATTSVGALFDADAPAGSRRRLVLAMALCTMVVELASIGSWVPELHLAGIPLSLSIVPALGLAAVCGGRLFGRSTARPAATAFWVAIGGAFLATLFLFLRSGRPGLWAAIVAASAAEELVFRLAIPAVLAAALRLGGVRLDRSRLAGLALAGLWFVLLPGHRDQMGSLAGALPFVAFAALAAVVVYRSGSILPMAMAHAVSNLLTFLMWGDEVTPPARSLGLTFVLVLLLIAYGRPRRLTIDDQRGLLDIVTGLEVASIDLRDGQPAAVTLSDGRILPVDEALGQTRPSVALGRTAIVSRSSS